MLAGMLALGAGPVVADGPALELEVSPATVRVGDRVRVHASARGGDTWMFGELTVALSPDGPWALAAGPTAVAGARPPAWELQLVPLAVGEQELPEITTTARPEDGEAVEVAAGSRPVVVVSSVLPAGEEPPAAAPLRDPVGVRGFPWEWVLPITGALLPLLAGLAWWWRGRGRAGAADPRSLLPPFAEIEALVRELGDRVGREPADGICDRLAAGLRRYFERRTGEPAAEMTSFELRLMARRLGWPESTQRLVQRVMGVADGVRFGRRPSSDLELRSAVDQALDAARSLESHLAPAAEQRETAEAS
jgi:hypothetical protein